MKFLAVLSVIVLSAQALPTYEHADLDEDVVDYNYNATRNADRSFGFASFGGGTYGGNRGSLRTVHDAWALRDAVIGNTQRTIRVRGRIDMSVLFTGSPGVVVDVGNYKTIQGYDNNAEITGGGFRILNSQQVIIRNLKFTNPISYAPGERPSGNGFISNQQSGEFTEVDSVLMEGATYVWVDHCEFSDDPWISDNIPNNRMRHDGLVDIKRASNYITVSNNIFRNHNKCMLIGHNDNNGNQDRNRLKTSITLNWFQGTKQRNPRVRYGEVHILNNLYTDMGTYGIGAGAGSSIIVERNVFHNSRAWRHPDGTPNPMGNLRDTVNQLLSGSRSDPVPSNVNWNPQNYFSYTSLPIGNVEAHVRRNAGRLR